MKRTITIIEEQSSLWVHFACCKTDAEEFKRLKLHNAESYSLLIEKYAGVVSALSNWLVKDICAAEQLAEDILMDIWGNMAAFKGTKEALINSIVATTRSYCANYNKLYARVKLN